MLPWKEYGTLTSSQTPERGGTWERVKATTKIKKSKRTTGKEEKITTREREAERIKTK